MTKWAITSWPSFQFLEGTTQARPEEHHCPITHGSRQEVYTYGNQRRFQPGKFPMWLSLNGSTTSVPRIPYIRAWNLRTDLGYVIDASYRSRKCSFCILARIQNAQLAKRSWPPFTESITTSLWTGLGCHFRHICWSLILALGAQKIWNPEPTLHVGQAWPWTQP
jgi:hypothetical protein